MKIAMSGASGFIGSHLAQFLTDEGHKIVPLERQMFRPENKALLCRALSECDAVINLAGAPVNKRWTHTYKKQIYESRIGTTRALTRALKEATPAPQVFISTSAAGYYPSWGEWDEYNASHGNGFLSLLCCDWEEAARECPGTMRLVIPRYGVVLSREGGALLPLLQAQRRLHAGIVIGNGEQPFPWISLPDLCRTYARLLGDNNMHGVYNFTSPGCVSQHELARVLAQIDGLSQLIAIPKFFFYLLYGESAQFFTEGQQVLSKRLQEAGFEFAHPSAEEFLSGGPVAEVSED